ncbi:MAG: hypothetical protein M3198_18825, partial [Actinomycetota bacterium]|nr:hypothetical protein [Actinomycetota bacterium]
NKVKIALVTGSLDRRPCGVTDYSYQLAGALLRVGVDVEILSPNKWDARAFREARRTLGMLGADLTHIQYPTTSYRTSLAPHLLALLERPCLVTLHEASQAHRFRQGSLVLFLARCERIVLTSAVERKYLLAFAPWVRGRTSVIPIGSNIPIGPEWDRRANRIVYFGLIAPNKGLEDVLKLAEIAESRGKAPLMVIGDVEGRFRGFQRQLLAQSRHLQIDWRLGCDSTAVAELLASSAVGYLPFPDGASERRGSLLALLLNGVATISTPGPSTTRELAKVLALASSPATAWRLATDLLEDESRREDLARRGRAYARRFDWEKIASSHAALYERVLKERG